MKIAGWVILLGLPLMAGGLLRAQTDAPPEMDKPLAPDKLPPLATPTPHPSGTLKVEFAGATAFPEAKLREAIARQIQVIEEEGLDEANAYDAAFFIDSFYRKQGYADVETTGHITGPWQLRLVIQEGPLTHVGTVKMVGNHSYDTPTLTKYLLGPTRERYPRIRKDINLPYVAADIQNGQALVARLYATEGYLEAIVEQVTVTFNADRTVANLTLTVNEGTQYRFGETRLIGPLVFSRETLLAVVRDETKDIFTDGRLAAAQRKLEDYYKKHGYYAATVTADGDPTIAPGGQVPVTFSIEPGPLFRFDGNTITGNSGVKTSFIEKRLQSLNGKTYDPALIDKKFRTLIGTGLFRNVRITPAAVGNDQVKLNISVDEAKPREVGFGLGYATFDGAIVNVNYTDRNLFGTGRPLTVDLEVNQRGYNGEIVYSDPWWFDSDYSLKVRLYALTQKLKGYSKNELGFTPTISRALTDHWTASAFVQLKEVALKDVLIDPESLTGSQRYGVVSVGLSQALDYRNNIYLPTRGFILSGAVDFAPEGISGISFIRSVARFSYYLPVTAKSYFSFGARAGVIGSLNSEMLPIDERFFNGGATTVRSFSELTLGPKDNAGYPLGGDAFTVFNVEYTFPIYGDLYGAVFVDAGNVISDARNFGVQDMRYAVGAGLRYNLPIGSIRFDYGLNPSPAPGEAQGAFHFAIGVAF